MLIVHTLPVRTWFHLRGSLTIHGLMRHVLLHPLDLLCAQQLQLVLLSLLFQLPLQHLLLHNIQHILFQLLQLIIIQQPPISQRSSLVRDLVLVLLQMVTMTQSPSVTSDLEMPLAKVSFLKNLNSLSIRKYQYYTLFNHYCTKDLYFS